MARWYRDSRRDGGATPFEDGKEVCCSRNLAEAGALIARLWNNVGVRASL
jgi:hypothetical protein